MTTRGWREVRKVPCTKEGSRSLEAGKDGETEFSTRASGRNTSLQTLGFIPMTLISKL